MAEGDLYAMRVNIVPQKTTCVQTAFGIAEFRLYDNGKESGNPGDVKEFITKLYPYQPKKNKKRKSKSRPNGQAQGLLLTTAMLQPTTML